MRGVGLVGCVFTACGMSTCRAGAEGGSVAEECTAWLGALLGHRSFSGLS